MTINYRPAIFVVTEMRVGEDREAKIIERLPYDGFITTDTIGYAGGLWILRKSKEVEILLYLPHNRKYMLQLRCVPQILPGLCLLFMLVLGLLKEEFLWNNLKTVAHLHNLPWLMLGDSNEVLCGEDKFGGNRVNLNRALDFKNCLDECNMLDLGFAGPKFTWTNRRPISNLILERIDQCFANPVWRMLFPEALVTYLPRTFLDHCPVLIELCRASVNQQNKPFRFQTMWLFHQDFPRVVQQAWYEDRNL